MENGPRLRDVGPFYVASHPTRLEILSRLEKNKKSYAAKLEELLKIDRKIIAFHLSTLEKEGLVKSEFGLKNHPEERPVAVRYYELTPSGKEVLSMLHEMLSR